VVDQIVELISKFLIFLLVSSKVCDSTLCLSSSRGGFPLMKLYFSISVGVFPRILNLFALASCSRTTQLLKWRATMRVSWFIHLCLLLQYMRHCGCVTPLLSVLSLNLKTLVFRLPCCASLIVRYWYSPPSLEVAMVKEES
jgi:hypothetical protein